MKDGATALSEERCRSAPRSTPDLSTWEYLRSAPLHDFPIRDEILYAFVGQFPRGRVLEIGPGSGITAFTVSYKVSELTAVEVAANAVDLLKRILEAQANVNVIQANLAEPGLVAKSGDGYELAYALDVLEYVPNPEVCFQNIAQALALNGQLFITFPNAPPPKGDGVTYFQSAGEITSLLTNAGFRKTEIFCVRLGTFAKFAYQVLHEYPMRLYRALRSNRSDSLPQTYEQTYAFRARERLSRFRLILNLYWKAIRIVLGLGGPIWRKCPEETPLLGHQIVIRAWK